MPPAPRPHAARARMKLVMDPARLHQTVPSRKIKVISRYGFLRPMLSEMPPTMGLELVEVRRNAVDSQDALLDEPKYDVMTGWDEAIIVASKQATK